MVKAVPVGMVGDGMQVGGMTIGDEAEAARIRGM